jgi:hypothetical protein
MSRIVIAPYHGRVSAARHIAEAVGGIRVKRLTSRYRYRDGDLVINWGRSDLPQYPDMLNSPASVLDAVNKLESLSVFQRNDVPTVEWTRSSDVARNWLGVGDSVLVRERVAGRGGAGILLLTGLDPAGVPAAPLYTKYFKHKDEFRIHVWGGNVIDIQKKKLRTEARDRLRTAAPDEKRRAYAVRNHANGWIFAREGVACPEQVSQAAISAVSALGLDFGAVDIGWNRHHNRAAVFEVNTAPGIEGTTLQRYIEAIRGELRR